MRTFKKHTGRKLCLWLIISPALATQAVSPALAAPGPGAFETVADDFSNFYSCRNLVFLSGAFGIGALAANTQFDENAEDEWQNHLAHTDLGHLLSETKSLGDGGYVIPVLGAAVLTGWVFNDYHAGNVVGEWGSRSLRACAVGVIPMLAMQQVTGGSRPGEDSSGSSWRFLDDNNGVSGHAFIGALPFLTAADMVDNPWAKGGLYICSTFTALSRIQDHEHYPSQAFLGWCLALAASKAVDCTELGFKEVHASIVPMPAVIGNGICLEAQW